MPANIFEKSCNNASNQLHTHFANESFSLYFSHTIRTFAQSLTGIFLPLYIFGLANKPELYVNEFTNNLAWVFIYYIFRSISVLLFITPATNVIFGKINFKASIFISNIAVSLSLIFILFADKYFWLILPTAIAASFDIMFYWIPFHLFFIRKSQSPNGHFGKQFGIRLFLTKIASALGPMIGGVLIISLGFSPLFLLSILLMLSSILPLIFSMEDHRHGKHNAYLIFKKYICEKSLFGVSTAFSVIAFEDVVYSIIWPLLLLSLTDSFAEIGLITTVSISVSALFAIYIGKRIDIHGSRFIHKIGITFNSIFYFIRFITNQTSLAFILDIGDKINGSLYGVPFNAKTYDIAKNNHYESDFMIYRVIIMHLTIACGLFIMLIFLPVIDNYKILFIVLGIITPLTYLIHIKKK